MNHPRFPSIVPYRLDPCTDRAANCRPALARSIELLKLTIHFSVPMFYIIIRMRNF